MWWCEETASHCEQHGMSLQQSCVSLPAVPTAGKGSRENPLFSDCEALTAVLHRASLDGILVGAALEIIALLADNLYAADGLR